MYKKIMHYTHKTERIINQVIGYYQKRGFDSHLCMNAHNRNPLLLTLVLRKNDNYSKYARNKLRKLTIGKGA